MSWFICDCFPDEGSQVNGSGIVILGRRGRNMQLCYCPGSRRPFDWILRKIRSECLHSGQLAQGSVPPAWHGSWLVLVCSVGYNKIPQAGWLITIFIPHSAGGWKSEIRLPAWLTEGSSPSHRFLVVSLCGGRGPVCSLGPLLYEH